MLNLKVHEFGKITLPNGDTRTALTRYSPYVGLSQAGDDGQSHETVFFQAGQFFDQSGKPLPNPPEWAKIQLAKMSPAALKDVGYEEPKPVPTEDEDDD